MEMDEAVCRLYSDLSALDRSPNLLRLIGIAVVQACSSAEAERGFYLRSLIKTKLRTRLKIDALDDLMRIKLCGDRSPSEALLCTSYRRWLSQKPRRIWKDNAAVLRELELFQSDKDKE
jgi:hypothetical protein